MTVLALGFISVWVVFINLCHASLHWTRVSLPPVVRYLWPVRIRASHPTGASALLVAGSPPHSGQVLTPGFAVGGMDCPWRATVPLSCLQGTVFPSLVLPMHLVSLSLTRPLCFSRSSMCLSMMPSWKPVFVVTPRSLLPKLGLCIMTWTNWIRRLTPARLKRSSG